MNETIARAREIIGALTPLNSDCGVRCGGACCQPDEDGKGGVYLFPGESTEEFSWGRVMKDEFGEMLICDAMCDREHRPFACRIFPLTPVRNAEGKWTVWLDSRARRMCPLYRSGIKGMNPEFARAVVKAVRVIAETPEGDAFLERWEALEKVYRLPF